VKKWVAAFVRSHLYEKCPLWWFFMGLILQGKLVTYLKNFRSFELVQYVGEK
jgi:hypothetical protein